MSDKKKDGPRHLQKTPRGEKKDEPQEPTQKRQFTALDPPQSGPNPREDAADKAAAIHAAQAAAAKAEDRANSEEPPEPEEEIEDSTPKHDDAYLEEVAQRIASMGGQMREQIQTEEQHQIIEDRLKERGAELKLSQMFEQGEFRQQVPIIPGDFEVEYRSITPDEDIRIKAMMSDEDENASIRYLQDKYAVVSLVCAVRAINGNVLPEHYTQAAGWSDKNYKEKSKIIFGMPTPAVWSLMVHNMWFDERCRKVFKMEDLKNG